MKKNKNDIWPVVRWVEERQAWKVDTRTKDGGGVKFFSIAETSKGQALDQAEAFAEAQRIKRGNEGSSAFGLSAAKRIDASAVFDMIADSATPNLTLREIANFWFRHHAAANGIKTVREVIDELIQAKTSQGRSPNYLADMRQRLGRFARSFGERKIADVGQQEVDDWIMDLPHAATTKNNFRLLLSVLLKYAKTRKYLVEVPLSKESVSVVKRGRPGILTVDQAAALLSACEDDILPGVAIGLFAGLRPEAEGWRLDWSKVHLERRLIDIDADATKNKGDNASVRWVTIPENLVAWLAPLAKKSGPVCPWTTYAYYRRLRIATKAAGIETWPHDALRHCFCSYHYALHQNAGLTMEQAGHTNSKTFFRHYRHRVLREDAERFFAIAPVVAGQEKIVSMATA